MGKGQRRQANGRTRSAAAAVALAVWRGGDAGSGRSPTGGRRCAVSLLLFLLLGLAAAAILYAARLCEAAAGEEDWYDGG